MSTYRLHDGREIEYESQGELKLLKKADSVLTILNRRKAGRMSPKFVKHEDHDELVNLARAIGLPVNAILAGSLKVEGDTVAFEELALDDEGSAVVSLGGNFVTYERVYRLRPATVQEDA